MTNKQATTLTSPGWAYGGFDAPYYLYIHECRDERGMPVYKEMRLIEEDLTARNVELMVRMGLTR